MESGELAGWSTDDDASRTEGVIAALAAASNRQQHARGAAWVTTSPSMEPGSSSGLMTLAAGSGYEEKPPQLAGRTGRHRGAAGRRRLPLGRERHGWL